MKNTFAYLKQLKRNNNREWFEKNRSTYESCRKESIDFVQQVINEIAKKDPEMKGLDASSCFFRINRDTRFSTDKTPYKVNFGANLNPNGKKSEKSGYYIHIEPGNCFAGAGIYHPEKDVLQKIRQELVYNGESLQAILKKKAIKEIFGDLITEDKLVKAPKGFDPEHPQIEYIKLKSFFTMKQYTDEVIAGKDGAKIIGSELALLKPFLDFLNSALS